MDIKSSNLAASGELRIEWAAESMPVLEEIRKRFEKTRPLRHHRIAACLHVTAETANLIRVLTAGGANVALCASNPLSTQDDVAAALSTDENVEVYAVRGEARQRYFAHIEAVLASPPTITIDDGADLVSFIHKSRQQLLPDILGGTEETTTGVTRLKSMARDGALKYPVIAVNNAATKHLFDNRYGTGQSTIDGILRATNRLLAGSCFVVAGYGWCGRGIAMRAKGMGAEVIVAEVDPMRALEAVMDGYRVMPMIQAASEGDIFCTAAGDLHVIDGCHFDAMKDGAIVCNAGHFNIEVNLEALEERTVKRRSIRDSTEAFILKDGRRIYVLGEGRLVNLSAAEGHPADVMDMSFANQALSAEYLAKSDKRLAPEVLDVPTDIDNTVARLKLSCMGVAIDTLTSAQHAYLKSWQQGT